MVKVYIYTDLPGSGKGWTLAVFATSRKDADNYIKCHYQGYKGKFLRIDPGPKITGHCGAVTENARLEQFGD